MTKTIYIHVRHWLFWYGVYGFCDKSRNDEITLYADKEKNCFLGHFDLLTQSCLLHLLNNILDRIEDKEYCDEIEAFIQGSNEIGYSYIYPRNEEDLSDQVNHHAPLNDKGHKPVYIYVWSKLSEAWDTRSIEQIVKILENEFLRYDIENVEFLEVPTYEETKISYENEPFK